MGLQLGSTNLPPMADINIDVDVTTAISTSNTGNGNSTMKFPRAVELLVLTFNCAKNVIDVPVFGAHLRGALAQDGRRPLPDLVVMSLQEIAPLSYSFLGEWFLGPYYTAFGDALNLAVKENQGEVGGRYTLVKAKNVGMTALLIFALHPERLDVNGMEEAEVGFGAADMGNKGAVGVRVCYSPSKSSPSSSSQGQQSTELTFVATHLAAMEWNLKKRNANWRAIVSKLTFANPLSVLPGVFPAKEPKAHHDRSGPGKHSPPPLVARTGSMDSSEEEDAPLLSPPSTFPITTEDDSTPTLTPSQKRQLQDISIFKPSSHLFVAGDLNYRISSTTPPPGSSFPSFDPSSEHHYSTFFSRDQLTEERLAGRTFHGMEEAEVGFGPTYKYDVLSGPTGAENEEAVRRGSMVDGVKEVPWKFAGHRWPAWTDRVLYSAAAGEGEMETVRYGSLPVVESSDHRAVFWRGRVPLSARGQGKEGIEDGEEGEGKKKLPVDIDVYSWERRQKARRREVVVGLLALVWSTKEGAVFLGTVAVVGMGWWWWFARGVMV
ncbi:Endonuclease/exonuclease/phosphatase [Triangularia setosa]|uniref:Endonuclease/exonuclease/phosphatase n=1 Tax=Triangularia setosa TaxID=2587417 RepID=A0AAN6W5Z7_9PEZI|nr:Endonuclease/exonuclease/phosphatase [Podospora setosa]